MDKRLIFCVLLLSGCGTRELVKTPSETRIEITPEELARYTETKSEIFALELVKLREEFSDLRRGIEQRVKDCICPSEMK